MTHVLRIKTKWIAPAFFLFAIPAIAHADAGTPLMWAAFWHLTIGNLMIGIGEAYLIARLFRPQRRLVVPKMILANYASMLGGMFLIPLIYIMVVNEHNNLLLFQLTKTVLARIFLTFVLTCLIEWPFCYWIFRDDSKRFKKSLLADLAAQSASYLLLIPFYLYASLGLGAADKLHHDQSILSKIGQQGTIYFISQDMNELWSADLTGKHQNKLIELPKIENWWGRQLVFYPSAQAGKYDLWLSRNIFLYEDKVNGKPDRAEDVLLISSLDGKAAFANREPIYGHTPTLDFREKRLRATDVSSSSYADLSEVSVRGHSFYVGTPVLNWNARCPTVLPGDFVIFEFANQIVCLHDDAVALVCYGKLPAVLLR